MMCVDDLVAQPVAYSSSCFALLAARSFSVPSVAGMPSGFGRLADREKHLVMIVERPQ